MNIIVAIAILFLNYSLCSVESYFPPFQTLFCYSLKMTGFIQFPKFFFRKTIVSSCICNSFCEVFSLFFWQLLSPFQTLHLVIVLKVLLYLRIYFKLKIQVRLDACILEDASSNCKKKLSHIGGRGRVWTIRRPCINVIGALPIKPGNEDARSELDIESLKIAD